MPRLQKEEEGGGRRTELSFHPADPNWRGATKLLGFLYQEWNGTVAHPRSVGRIAATEGEEKGGAREEKEENLVVVADDDFVYLPSWLESLLLVGHRWLPHSAVALRGLEDTEG